MGKATKIILCFILRVRCSFFIWVKQKTCKHRKYDEGNCGDSMRVRVCEDCNLIDVEKILSRKNGFRKIK